MLACGGDKAPAPPPVSGPRLPVAVDRRVELVSIIFRIAGRPRYTLQATPYAKAVDAKFGARRDASVIALTNRPDSPAGFELAPNLAVHLDDKLHFRLPLDPLPPTLKRWTGLDAAYVDAVRAFATETAVDDFLATQHDYIAKVEAADRAFYDRYDLLGWFDRVFGPRSQTKFQLVPGLLNGPMDYAARVELADGNDEIYVVAYLEQPDEAGVPTPTAASVPFVVHELCHSYTNPIVDAALDQIQPIAVPAIAKVADKLAAQAYNTDAIVLEESVVRALVVLWVRDQDPSLVETEIVKQEKLGFVWTRPLADALAAARAKHDGKLDAATVVKATRDTFAALR